jgi:hypothetical protein
VDDAAAAWQDFCGRLAAAGATIASGDHSETDSAEGLRHLSRLAVMALQSHLEFGDVDFPAFHRYDDDAVKWGGPNADNQYLRARIDPTGTYRIVGDVSGVRDLILSIHEGDMQLGEYGVHAERRLGDLRPDPDGRLLVQLGGPAPDDGDWVPIDPNSRIVLIRVYVTDWRADGLPWFDIERLDRPRPAPQPLDDTTDAEALNRATTWIDASLDYWPRYLEDSPVRQLVNRLTPPRPAAGGSDRIRYGAGWWHLGPEEVLAIEFPDPGCEYWSFQLYSTPWFESLDLRNRTVSANSGTATVDPDGVVRIAVSGDDPGVPNWLDTEGRREGMVSYRLVGADGATGVPAASLTTRDRLWPEIPRLTAGERSAQIRDRRFGVARRFRR